MEYQFVKEMMAIGIISYRDQEKVWQIARRCAITTGLPMAGAGAIFGVKSGTVTVPGIGTLTGSVAGALAGLFAGTLSCTMLNVGLRQQLRDLANGEWKDVQVR